MPDFDSTTSGEFDAASTNRARRPFPGPRGLWMGLVGGVLLALIAATLFILLTRDRVPQLTEASYDAALKLWDSAGPQDYDLDLKLTGNRPGDIHIEVRGGEVTHMTRDGVEPKQKRTWEVWSVPGQFDTIGQELEMAHDPAAAFNAPSATRMVMWAEFDPKFGYPKRYDRLVLGADFEVHWQVTSFRDRTENK